MRGDRGDKGRGGDHPDHHGGDGDLSLAELVNQLTQDRAHQCERYGLDGGQGSGQ